MTEKAPDKAVVAKTGEISAEDLPLLVSENGLSTDHSFDEIATAAPPGECEGKRANSHFPNGAVEGDSVKAAAVLSDVRPESVDGLKKRKRHRRGRRRRYKPYSRLTYDEMREKDQRETQRAEAVRANRFAHGKPMAPYNTTQFLLEDIEARSSGAGGSDEAAGERRESFSGSAVGSETSEAGSWPSDAGEIEREFECEYEAAHSEQLEELSKEQLVRDFIALEQHFERAVEDVRRLQRENAALRLRLVPPQVQAQVHSAPESPSL